MKVAAGPFSLPPVVDQEDVCMYSFQEIAKCLISTSVRLVGPWKARV